MQVIPMFNYGGAEIMCENLCYGLKELGHQVIAVSLYDFQSEITKRLLDKGIEIRYLDKKRGVDLSMISKLTRLFISEKPDVVHTHIHVLPYVVPAVKKAKVKRHIHTIHTLAKMEDNAFGRMLNKRYYKKKGVIPVALSEFAKKTVTDVYKLRADSVPVVYNGIDLSKCKEKNTYAVSDKFTFVHIGSLIDVKNHRLMIDAFSKLSDENICVKFIGQGLLEDELKSEVKAKGLDGRIEFLGVKPYVYEYLVNADAFIFPSKYEGVPMTLIEAMGTGLPIVASNVGGIQDMLTNNENAILINPTIDELVSAIKVIVNDEVLREQLGKCAKERALEFSYKIMSKKYEEIYMG